MMQLQMIARRVPALPDGIVLTCGDLADALPLSGDLVIADPPWSYARTDGTTNAADHYSGLTVAQIISHLSQLEASRLVLWITWPILAADWPEALPEWGKPVTGGAWVKSDPGDAGHYGQGYHWAGCSEPVLVYSKAKAYNDRSRLRNAWIEAPTKHSRKPVGWMAQMIQRWCPPGGTVIDPYAGLGSVAEAVLEAGEGRRYRGVEIDPQRFADAQTLIASATRGQQLTIFDTLG
jgi:hypothetical protein